MDGFGESPGALDPVVVPAGAPSPVAIEAPEAAVAELVEVAADAHHRIRSALGQLARTSTATVLMFLRYGAPDEARLDAGLAKARCDIHRIRGPF